MKNLISILFVMMIVGCGQSDVERLEEENRRMKAELENRKLKSNLEAENKKLKEDLLKLSVVGEYVRRDIQLVLLQNGDSVMKDYHGGFPEMAFKIIGKEVHIYPKEPDEKNETGVFKIESNGDLKMVAEIEYGKRKERNAPFQTFKRIK